MWVMNLPAKFVSGTRVQLGDKALIPASGDSHIHFASFATFHAGLNPFRTYADNGILQALGSDGPCTDPEPMVWVHKACNNGAESLTVQQALKMATYNTYWMSFDEKDRGSLEVGKFADMVILSGNPYETDVTKLDTIHVEQLLLQGEPYQKIRQNPILHVLRGMK